MKRAWLVAAGILLLAVALLAVAGYLVQIVWFPRHRGHLPADRTRYLLFVLDDVLEQYREDRGQYPGTDEGLEALVREGFIRRVPIDPWDKQFQYRFPGSEPTGRFDLWSTGADGKPGGEGENADISLGDDGD